MGFHGMKRKELQQLCKQHGIPANLTNLEMANKLSTLLKIEKKSNPIWKTRSCLKICSDVLSENETDLMNKKGKKVRFSPENDVFPFRDRKVEFLQLDDVRRGRCKKRNADDEGDLDVENKGEGDLSRVTRAKALLGQKVTLSSPVVMKKRAKRGVQEDEKRGNGSILVVDLNSCVSDERNETVAVKSLRNRKVESVVPAKSIVRNRNARTGIQSVGGEALENKDVEADGGISHLKTGVRRSTRNVKTSEASDGVNGEMGCSKPLGSRGVSSGAQVAVAAGCETESEPQVKNDDVPVILRKNLRKKGAKNTTSKCKDNGNESDIVEKEENVAPPKMSLRRSSRNKERTEDSGQLVVELPAVDLLQRKNVRSVKGFIQGVETNRKNVRSVKGSIHCDEKISETAVMEETDLKVSRKITRQSAKSSVEDVDKKAVTGKLANPEVVPRQSERKRSELAQVEPVQEILGGTEVAGRRKITRSRNQAQAKTSILDGKSGDVTAEANEVVSQDENPLQHFADDIEVPPKSAESLRYQTRFSDKRISLTPQTKKAKVEKPVASNLGKRSTVNRGSPNQLTELLPLEKGSEIEHVRRSKRNALGDESHVISEDAHGSDFKKSMTKKQGRETIRENLSAQHTGQHVSRTPDNLPDKLEEGTTVAVESRTRSGFQQKSFKHTAKKLRMSGKPTIDEKDSPHRSREHSTTPEHSETAKVRKSQNASKTSLLAASSSASRVTRSNTVADEPRTRSGICLKSVKHTTKKLRMSGKPGLKITNNEKGSPEKLRERSIATGHSETDSEVRRSNNAYETNSLAASSDANGTGSTGIVSTEHVSGVEEHLEQFTHSARNTNKTSSMKELSLKEPESSSAPPIPDCNTVLGGPATGSHPESSSGAIAKDGIPCSMEASAKNIHLADAKDPLNMGEAETSTTCSIKLPADEDLVNESCNNNQTPVVYGPSRRFTRSALKGKTDGPTYGRGKTFNEKSHSISKLPLLNAESSLPKAVMAGAGPGDVNVSSSCPKVDTPTINIVSSTSDLSEDKTACVTPERSSAKNNIVDLYLQEFKGPESLNTLKTSLFQPLKLQSNHDEIGVDISTSKHTPVVKPSSYDLQASIPQIVGHITCSVSRENNKSEASDSSLPLCVTEVANLVAVVNEEQKHEESPSRCRSDIRPDTAAEDDKSLCKEQASIRSADDSEHNQIGVAKDESEIRTIRDICDVPEVVSVSQASGDDFVGEKCTEIEPNLYSTSVEKVLAVELDSEAVDKVPSDVKDRCHTPLMDSCGKGEGTVMSMMKSNTNFGEEFSSQHDNRVEQVKDFDDVTLAHTVANQMDAELMRSTGKCTSERNETDAHYDEKIEKTGPSTTEINSLISDGNLVEDGGSYCDISSKVEAEITSLSDSKEDLYGKDTLECQQFVDALQQSDDMKIGETDTHLKEKDEGIDHQSVHILQQSDMNVGETGSDLEVTDQENGHRLVDVLQQSDMNAGKTDSNLKGIDQENDDTPILEQADVVIVIADNGESSRNNVNAIDAFDVIDQEGDAKRLPTMELQRKESATDAALAKFLHGGESVTLTGETNDAAIDTIHIFDEVVDASKVLTEKLQWNEDAMAAPTKLQQGGLTSTEETNEAQGISANDTTHISDQEVDASNVELQWNEDAVEVPTKLQHDGLTSTEETNEVQGISANDTTHVSDQEIDATNMEFQRNEDAMEAAPSKLQYGGGESLTSTEEANEAQCGCAVQTIHLFDLDVDASGAITEESKRNEDAMEIAPAKLQYGVESVASPEKTIGAQGGSSANLIDISDCGPGELSFNIENLSPEVKSFIRSDEVDGENSHLWSEDTSFMFDKSNNAEEQDILTGYPAEEHVHNSGEELVGERAVEERETFNDIQAVEHLCNTGEEVFREEYTESTENQHAASYNPNYRDDNNAVENSVATPNETNSESQANKGAHQNNACDYSKPNEDLTKVDS